MFSMTLGLFTFLFFFSAASLLLEIGILRVITGSLFAAISALIFSVLFVHWMANTSEADERLSPTLYAILFGIIAFVIYLV